MEPPIQDPTTPVTLPIDNPTPSIPPVSILEPVKPVEPQLEADKPLTETPSTSDPITPMQPVASTPDPVTPPQPEQSAPAAPEIPAPEIQASEVKPKSSNPTVMVAVAILVLFAGGIGFFYYSYKNASSGTVKQATPYSVYTPQNNQQVTPSPVIDSDTQNIDNTTASLDADMNTVNSSLSDKPTDLSQ